MDNKLPKISLKYVFTYDQQWSLALNKGFDLESSREKYRSFLKNFRLLLTEETERKALQLISKYSGLDWKEDEIVVYLVNNLNISGFARPFTLRMDADYALTCNVLIHELVHTILNQNRDRFRSILEHLKQTFPKENMNTIVHLIVTPIEKKVFSEIFGVEKYKLNLEKTSKFKGFDRVYNLLDEIYPKLGENILDSLLKIG